MVNVIDLLNALKEAFPDRVKVRSSIRQVCAVPPLEGDDKDQEELDDNRASVDVMDQMYLKFVDVEELQRVVGESELRTPVGKPAISESSKGSTRVKAEPETPKSIEHASKDGGAVTPISPQTFEMGLVPDVNIDWGKIEEEKGHEEKTDDSVDREAKALKATIKWEENARATIIPEEEFNESKLGDTMSIAYSTQITNTTDIQEIEKNAVILYKGLEMSHAFSTRICCKLGYYAKQLKSKYEYDKKRGISDMTIDDHWQILFNRTTGTVNKWIVMFELLNEYPKFLRSSMGWSSIYAKRKEFVKLMHEKPELAPFWKGH